jgi:hypothetical protein
LAALWAAPRLGRTVLCFLVWPLLFGTLLCELVQPIWLDRTFAFCAPFVAVALGGALGEWLDTHGSRLARSLLYSIVCVFSALVLASGWIAYVQASTSMKGEQFRDLARYLAAHTAAGEIIYAPRDIEFWGINRYLIGPDWGSMLKIQDVAVLNVRKRWRRLYASLGPAELERLGVMPETRRVDGYRIPIYTGPSPLPDLPSVTGEWLVSNDSAQLQPPEDWNLCTEHYPVPMSFGGLQLYHWRCGDAVSALPRPRAGID